MNALDGQPATGRSIVNAPARRRGRRRVRALAPAAALGVLGALAACGGSSPNPAAGATGGSPRSLATAPIVAVGAENQYANVIAQLGGRYVRTAAIMSNPNTDPHTFEASPSVAQLVSRAQLIVQNGVGYDEFMAKIEAASPNPKRKVIVVGKVLGLAASTPNPHLWYSPQTMPAVAAVVAGDLSQLEPSHTAYFHANLIRFEDSLRPWYAALAAFRRHYPNTPVATTEPVADYMLRAAGADNKTPFTLQAAIMNGTDPAPQDVAREESLLTGKHVKALLYNRQVTDSITEGFLTLAVRAHIPIVGVYETMPTPGFTYQSWMVAEVTALRQAVAAGRSTTRLVP